MRAWAVAVVVLFCSTLTQSVAGDPPSARASRAVRDGAGRQVQVPLSPRRIVSLAPSVTEMLFALGAGERVVGVTDFCDFPREAESRPRIGGLINPDLERIVSLSPDLAVATTTGNYLDDVERIERVGIPVYTVSTPTIEAMLGTLRQIGELVGAEEAARGVEASLRERIERVRAAAAGRGRLRALFVIEADPLIAPGRGTFIGEALSIAGADLVTSEASGNWVQYDLERVIAMKPELILTTQANGAWASGLSRRAEWERVPAVAQGRIAVVSDSIQHPGPRMVDGIEEVGRIVARGGRATEAK